MIDWLAAERKLYDASVSAVQQFAEKHGEEHVCFFAFDSEPRYGYVIFAFDTPSNNLRKAQARECYCVEIRDRYLRRERKWQTAAYDLTCPPVELLHTNSGDFAYSQFSEAHFPEWEDFANSAEYPARKEHEDDYLDSNVRVLFWNVAQRLIDEEAFRPLQLAASFVIGYGIHDQEEAVLRVVKWPSAQ